MKPILVLFSCLLCTAGLTKAETPTEALAAFWKTARSGDFDATWKRVVKFDKLPPEFVEDQKEKVRKMIKLGASGWSVEALEEKVDGDCAVIVGNEVKGEKSEVPNLDPVYLLKQDNEWKVFAKLTKFDLAAAGGKEKLEVFGKLKKWYEERKQVLRQMKP